MKSGAPPLPLVQGTAPVLAPGSPRASNERRGPESQINGRALAATRQQGAGQEVCESVRHAPWVRCASRGSHMRPGRGTRSGSVVMTSQRSVDQRDRCETLRFIVNSGVIQIWWRSAESDERFRRARGERPNCGPIQCDSRVLARGTQGGTAPIVRGC